MNCHCHEAKGKLYGHLEGKLAFCVDNLRVKWLKLTGSFPWHIPVLLTAGSARQ